MGDSAAEMLHAGKTGGRVARIACCGDLGSAAGALEDSLRALDAFLAPFCSQQPMIDVHCHLQRLPLQGRSPALAEHLSLHCIAACSVCATSPADWADVEALHLQAPKKVLPSFGIHPWWLRDYFLQNQESPAKLELPTYLDNLAGPPGNWKRDLAALLTKYPQAGVGECGVDKSVKDVCSLDVQFEVLKEHVQLAAEHSRFLSIHCVGSWGRLLSCLEEMHALLHPRWPASIILHFVNSLPVEMAAAYCRLPKVYFSFSAAIATNTKHLQLWSALPLERILLESDSPDQLPRTVRDSLEGAQVNTPAILTYSSAVVAESLGCDVDELRRRITENARQALRWSDG